MRVLFAPDKFAGTLTAVEAARAMAQGWADHAPDVESDLVPMADGGPGFVEVLHASLGGERVKCTVQGPLGVAVQAEFLVHAGTAYVEAAQANGLHLSGRDAPLTASTRGVGELILAALEQGVRRVVVGAGGSGTTDGGAGLLAALGATADVDLDAGPRGLRGLTRIDLTKPRMLLDGVELVLASDVDNPLTGLFGAAKVYGPQKGLDESGVMEADRILEEFARLCGRREALSPGAGAAGGLGYALLLLGARRVPGFEVVAQAVGLDDRVQRADVVVTGEGAFDVQSGAGKVPAGVAAMAQAASRGCVVVAGRVDVGAREARVLGVDSAYACVDVVGLESSMAQPHEAVRATARRAAASWTP